MARALRGDRRRTAARKAPRRRPRHLFGRRFARQDGSDEHGSQPGSARAIPRSGRRRACALPPHEAEGSRPRQETPATAGGRPLDPAPHPQRAQARVLDSGRSMAARRTRAARPRAARAGAHEEPGVLRAKGRDRVAGRPRRQAPRLQPTAVGTDVVLAVGGATGTGYARTGDPAGRTSTELRALLSSARTSPPTTT